MNEDELMATGPDMDDALVPDGWNEGDDIFASAAPAEDDGTLSELAEGTDNGLGELMADDNTNAEAADEQSQSAENSGSRILKLRVNRQDREVDLSKMSDEELIAQLQKGYAFDAMKEKENAKRYRQIYDDQIMAGMTSEAAKLIAKNEMSGKEYALFDEDDEDETEDEAPASGKRDYVAEVQQLRAIFPDMGTIPDEVAVQVAKGADLITAYTAYRAKESAKTAETVKHENKILKQNAANAVRSPVRGTTTGGRASTSLRGMAAFNKGFDSDPW